MSLDFDVRPHKRGRQNPESAEPNQLEFERCTDAFGCIHARRYFEILSVEIWILPPQNAALGGALEYVQSGPAKLENRKPSTALWNFLLGVLVHTPPKTLEGCRTYELAHLHKLETGIGNLGWLADV
jgi:hypothetical protein